MPTSFEYASKNEIANAFKPRKADSRKGQNGVVAVIGGSRLYHGAPALSALAAQRTGVDLVYLAVPKAISAPLRALSPNFIVIPLPDDKLTPGSVNKLLKWLPPVNSAVIGPGLGRQRTEGMEKLVSEFAAQGVKILLDADALRSELVKRVKGRDCVLTPHAGEFNRVFGFEPSSNLEKRALEVKRAAVEAGCTVLLKGQYDVISQGERVIVDVTGSPAMTVGGTGDTLSGVVGGLMAQGATCFEAAVAGAYVIGAAGERAAARLGMHIVATDLIEELPHVMKVFDKVI